MRFNVVEIPNNDPERWHLKFAWAPTRISRSTVVWLEFYWRRLIVVDPGNWAGGYKWRWAFCERWQLQEYLGPVKE